MEQRTCKACANTYDLTRTNFPKLENFCRLCVRERNKKIRDRKAARRKAAMDKIEEAGADLYTSLAAEGGSNIPHSAEVLERVFQYFGGVAGFSAMLVKQYYDSPPGSPIRSKLLETIVRLVSKNVDAGGAKKPLSLWTEEELEAELDQRFKQAVSHYRGTTINVQAQALEAPEGDATSDDPDACDSEFDGVPEGGVEDTSVGTEGEAAGSPEVVSPNADAAEGA
jgi:hypothetical protein